MDVAAAAACEQCEVKKKHEDSRSTVSQPVTDGRRRVVI